MTGLARKSIWATAWAISARLSRTLVGIATLAILSRFLSPADFGLAALVLFVTSLSTALADFGTRVALVQRKQITYLEQVSVFWTGLGLAGLIALSVFVFADPLARLLGNPDLAGPLRWITPTFLLGALQSLPLTMLEREGHFNTIAQAEILSALLAAAVAVIMALIGFRIGALIAQQLTLIFVTAAVYNYKTRWRPDWAFSWSALKPLLGYGGYVTGAGLVQTLSSQIERPIVGSRLSASDLGFLSMSQQITQTPLRVVGGMSRKVMFPIMSTIQDDLSRVSRGAVEMQYGLAALLMPVCLALWALSDLVVGILLGADWSMVAVLMSYGTLYAALTIFGDVNLVLLSSQGQARFMFFWGLFSLAVRVCVLLLSVPYGLEAVVAAQLGLMAVMTVLQCTMVQRRTGVSFPDRLRVVIAPLVSAMIMAAAMVAVDHLLQSQAGLAGAEVARLLILLVLGAVVYVGMQLLIDRGRFLGLLQTARSLRRNSAS